MRRYFGLTINQQISHNINLRQEAFTMKIQRLFTKTFWLVMVSITVIVGTIFRLSVGVADATTTPPAQVSPETVTIAHNYSNSGGNTLYDRLGGYNAIAAVIDDALPRIVNDPQLSKYFVGLSTDSKQRVRQFLVDQFCKAAQGPCLYRGRSMKTSHGGLGISQGEFQAFVNDVQISLNKFNVSQNDQNALVSYMNGLKGDIVER